MTKKLTSALIREVHNACARTFKKDGASIDKVAGLVDFVSTRSQGSWTDAQVEEAKTDIKRMVNKASMAAGDGSVDDNTHLKWDILDWGLDDARADQRVREIYYSKGARK